MRNFESIAFEDRYGQQCSLQQSSVADYEPPGSSAVWFGVDGHRMHIGLDQMKKLLPHLQVWVETGSFRVVKNDYKTKTD